MRTMLVTLSLVAIVATVCRGGTTKGGPSGSRPTSGTSPEIAELLAAVPGDAFMLGFVDLAAPAYSYLTGFSLVPIDPAARAALDEELRAYLDRSLGLDVTKVQHAVGFYAGPPLTAGVIVRAVGGAPRLDGSTTYAGATVWRVDPARGLSMAVKGELLVFGADLAVRSALDALAGTRASVRTTNPALVDWLGAETRGAMLGAAVLVPPALATDPDLRGLSRVALSAGRARPGASGLAGMRVVIAGDDAALERLQTLAARATEPLLAQMQQARDAALAGQLGPLDGAWALMAAAQAKALTAQMTPRRDGDRLTMKLEFAGGTDEQMWTVAGVGVLTAVAIPAFIEYMRRGKRSEADLQLNRIGKNLKVYYIENASFPVGEVGLTPAQDCCLGPGKQCPGSVGWDASVWQALDFGIDEPHRYQFRYRSDGTTAVVEAVGDLDCDGTAAVTRLEVTAPGGNPTARTIAPEPGTD